MNLQERILLLIKLGNYLKSNDDNWLDTQVLAEQKNGWFTREFLEKAAGSIADNYLKEDKLRQWAGYYKLDDNIPVSYTHLRAHETVLDLVCRLLLEQKTQQTQHTTLPHNI